jgi:translation initiation factor 4G
LDKINDLEQQKYYYNIKSCISQYAAFLICNSILKLNTIAIQLKNGAHYPLFYLCLQNINSYLKQNKNDDQDENWLLKQLENQNINLIDMLPGKRPL